MAVKLESTIKRFVGLSTDEKPQPTLGETIPDGSSFMERDTGEKYLYGDGMWRAARTDDDAAQLLAIIVTQLEEIKTILKVVTVA